MKYPLCLRLLFAAALAALGGCSTLGYYGQAINGELKILGERQPIETVVNDPATPAGMREKLKLVLTARSYASAELGLPQGKSYRSYVALNRDYPVWVVYAAPAFSLTSVDWCFPFAGCVPYRGYFHEQAAAAFAGGLAERGDDVFVTGAPAYSTLGWFADPVYSSMLQWSDAELAGTIFHELAHQKLYVKNDSAFNESFADTVEDIGIERFFATHDPKALTARRNERQAERAAGVFVEETRTRLAAVYASHMSDAEKRSEKAAVFRWLTERYREVGTRFGIRYSPEWLAKLNNASLAAMNTYDRWIPAFKHLLQCEDGKLPDFYRAAARIGALPTKTREARLQALTGLKDDKSNAGAVCTTTGE